MPLAYDTTEVPNEIWLNVFSYVTFIPGALACDDGHAMACFAKDKDSICLHRRYRDVMDTKLSMSLVSKKWNALAVEFMFEYLLVKDGDHIVRIASTLKQLESNSRIRTNPGRWTFRLEFAFEGVHVWKKAHGVGLSQIFKSCPKLAILSTISCTSDAFLWQSSGLMRSIKENLKGLALRRLECKGEHELLQGLVFLAPSLEVLWVLSPPKTSRKTLSLSPDIQFLKLHTLVVSDATAYHSSTLLSCHMPSLVTLVYDTGSTSSTFLMGLDQFLHRNGKQLRYLTLPSYHTSDAVIHICPGITHWTVACDAGSTLRANQYHSSIRCITLEFDSRTRLGMLPLTLRVLQSILADAESYLSLEVLRFQMPISAPQVLGQSWRNSFCSFLQTCEARGIRVEVSVGVDEQSGNLWRPL